jgi:hypothetical protein
MSLRYLLLFLIVLYVVVVLLVPALQSLFGYGAGGLIALVVLYFVFFSDRSTRL